LKGDDDAPSQRKDFIQDEVEVPSMTRLRSAIALRTIQNTESDN